MAEIKSTMEMVMERAARMSKRSDGPSKDVNFEQEGMRLAADYLDGQVDQLGTLLMEQPKEKQLSIRKGMFQTLLRNITLPRDETLVARSEKAIQGLLQLDSSGSTSGVCQEIGQILGQYNQHKDQVKQQLEEAIRGQLQQQLAQQGQQVSDPMSINPAMHPKYREEMARATSDLNNQYNQALEERKESIRQRLI